MCSNIDEAPPRQRGQRSAREEAHRLDRLPSIDGSRDRRYAYSIRNCSTQPIQRGEPDHKPPIAGLEYVVRRVVYDSTSQPAKNRLADPAADPATATSYTSSLDGDGSAARTPAVRAQ